MYREKVVKTPAQALESLRRSCAKMERCELDARRSLYRFGIINREEQNQIIELLKHDKFIDNERYAGAYVRDKVSAGRWGVAKIIAGLKAKSIDKEIIAQVVQDNVKSSELNNNLQRDLERQAQKLKSKGESGYNLRVKLFRRAASRGFDFEDINDVLDNILDEDF